MSRRIRSAALNGNTYFTSDRGILKSTSASAAPSFAGLPRCLDLQLSLSSAGAPVLLTDTGDPPTAGNNQARGYRGVWCQRDANNNLVQGQPSSRFFIANTAGATRDVSITANISPEITTSHFLQLYAAAIIDNGTSVDVGDEERLVLEYYPTLDDITAGALTVVDIVPNAFRADDLYTNQSQEGAAEANARPPLARDLCAYRRRMLYANYTLPHRLEFQMLGTLGVTAGMTLTIGGVVLTAGTGETVSSGTFHVFKSGGGGFTDKGTQSLNVEYTTKSICNVINGYAAVTGYYAFYQSGPDDAPGWFILEERGVGGAAFVATCSSSTLGGLFSPAVPTSGTTYTSTAPTRPNRIRVSKTDQPEACPEGDEIVVGGEDEAIERIIPLRSSVIVIKTHSIWRLVDGTAAEEPTFVDDTVSIAGRDSAAKLNNTVIFLSDQGFVAVGDNGAQIAGRPVERYVIAGLEAINAPDHDTIVGIGHEQRRLYICSVWDPAAGERTCYMYSPIANRGKGTWTKRRLNANAFAVLNNRLIYALNNDNGHVLRSRASLRDGDPWYRDYCEDSATFTIASIDTVNNIVTGTLAGGVDFDDYEGGPDIGWKFYQGGNQYLVLGGNGAADPTWTIVCNTVAGLVPGAVTIYRPVDWKIEFAPFVDKNPLELKQFCDVLVKAETSNAYAIDFSYANQTDTKATPYTDDWDNPPPADRVFVPKASGERASLTNNDFGLAVGGVVPFNQIRTVVPQARAGGEQLSVRMSGGTAEGYVGIKSLALRIEGKDSGKGRA